MPELITELQQHRRKLGLKRSALLAGDNAPATTDTVNTVETADFQQPRVYIPRYFHYSPEALFRIR